MGNKVTSEQYGMEKHILIANNSYMVTLPAIIKNSGESGDENGKVIIKAGSPLYGDITKRGNGFRSNSVEGNPTCVLLHDVDVTDGDNNGTIVIAGVVDLLKLDSTVVTKINSVQLPERIIFVEGSAI